jgi:structural maintenance of chromosome 4
MFLESDDDDDHHEDPARPAEDAEPGEGKVKLEPGDETATKVMTSQERTPSYELHIYSVEELSAFKKREMIADAELLDGEHNFAHTLSCP